MANPIGYSFVPSFENAELGKRGGSPPLQPQDAIQVLNFRLPRVVGAASANAISPLVGEERRGDFGGAVFRSVLRTVFGDDAAASFGSPAASARSSPSAPSPSSVFAQPRDPGASVLDAFARPSRPVPAFSSPSAHSGGSTDDRWDVPRNPENPRPPVQPGGDLSGDHWGFPIDERPEPPWSPAPSNAPPPTVIPGGERPPSDPEPNGGPTYDTPTYDPPWFNDIQQDWGY